MVREGFEAMMATCMVAEPPRSGHSLVPTVLANGACFDMVCVHSLQEAVRAAEHVGHLTFAVVDDSVDNARAIVYMLCEAFPNCVIVFVSDFPITLGPSISVVPHDFPDAIAVAMLRGRANANRQRSL